ncbi:arsenic resistance N-acetyltransferase ArsN2 [Pontibacter sp. G13]|uniref:arsenic resistance N-acetyltransferase ArsN2 n=1 Tax=Pontibacter sp. G13 TaxID=3074898 RepID=UPI00288A05E1|nr:arsenic resistance N-acetyltransferase ArsN2 [Pontibacter sp. G13]WNJ21499.1 arsenic resistance N-acetyltransferase ArsN2 [Pontibacter sp. G13]
MNTSRVIQPVQNLDLTKVADWLRKLNLPTDDLHAGIEFYGIPADDEWLFLAGIEPFGSDGLLRSVGVSPAQQGSGIGSEAIRQLLDVAGSQYQDLYLLTTTAEVFFSRLGFERISREEVPATIQSSAEFADICPVSAAVMKFSCENT